MNLDIYETIWLKHDTMSDSNELYTLIFVYTTLTLIQGHGDPRKVTFCAQYLQKLTINLDGIWQTIDTCKSDQSFHLLQEIFEGENLN